MSYDTYYSLHFPKLSKKAFTREDKLNNLPEQEKLECLEAASLIQQIVQDIVDTDPTESAELVLAEMGGSSGEYCNSWDGFGMEETLIEVSKRYPDQPIEMYVNGEESEDFRMFSVLNGKAKWHESSIVYDDGVPYAPKTVVAPSM